MGKNKEALEEAKILKKTGQEYAFWRKELDRFKALKKGHIKTTEFLTKKHKVDGKTAFIISIRYQKEKYLKR